VNVTFPEGETLEESQLEEHLKEMRIDAENIAQLIAANTGKSFAEVVSAMQTRTTLNPESAKARGLVHEIKSELFEVGAELISIQYVSRSPAKDADPLLLDVRRATTEEN
jgi:hypothetical protein